VKFEIMKNIPITTVSKIRFVKIFGRIFGLKPCVIKYRVALKKRIKKKLGKASYKDAEEFEREVLTAPYEANVGIIDGMLEKDLKNYIELLRQINPHYLHIKKLISGIKNLTEERRDQIKFYKNIRHPEVERLTKKIEVHLGKIKNNEEKIIEKLEGQRASNLRFMDSMMQRINVSIRLIGTLKKYYAEIIKIYQEITGSGTYKSDDFEFEQVDQDKETDRIIKIIFVDNDIIAYVTNLGRVKLENGLYKFVQTTEDDFDLEEER
jgi:hypothetical protein